VNATAVAEELLEKLIQYVLYVLMVNILQTLYFLQKIQTWYLVVTVMDFWFLIKKLKCFVAVLFVIVEVSAIENCYGAKICLPLAKNFRTIEFSCSIFQSSIRTPRSEHQTYYRCSQRSCKADTFHPQNAEVGTKVVGESLL